MTRHPLFPFEYNDGPRRMGEYSIVYFDVTFTSDFGPVTQGEMFYAVCIDADQGILFCDVDYNPSGDDPDDIATLHKVRFECVLKGSHNA